MYKLNLHRRLVHFVMFCGEECDFRRSRSRKIQKTAGQDSVVLTVSCFELAYG